MDSRAIRVADRARVAQLTAQIRLLQTQLEPHQQRLDDYRYPVLTLPNEVVTEIFIQYLPPYPECPPLTGPSSPTRLTQICRKWREIALASPQLWRAISLQSQAVRRDEQAVLTWFERSGSCPLSIQMQSGDSEGPWLPAETKRAILQCSQRWEYVKLALADSELGSIQGPLPLLRELSLKMANFASNQRPHANAVDFPRLGTFALNNLIYVGDWVPWSQLTCLTLREVSPSEYLSHLQTAVNLLELKIVDCKENTGSMTVTLPRLETLTLIESLHGSCKFTQALRVFILPSLRTVQLPARFLGEHAVDAFASFISTSVCADTLRKVLFTGQRTGWGVKDHEFRDSFPAISDITFGAEGDDDGDWNWDLRWPGLDGPYMTQRGERLYIRRHDRALQP